jgi:hypothetical protein
MQPDTAFHESRRRCFSPACALSTAPARRRSSPSRGGPGRCGWMRGAEGELLLRVDPRHRSLGQFFQDEIATPLGLDLYTFQAPRGFCDESRCDKRAHETGVENRLLASKNGRPEGFSHPPTAEPLLPSTTARRNARASMLSRKRPGSKPWSRSARVFRSISEASPAVAQPASACATTMAAST